MTVSELILFLENCDPNYTVIACRDGEDFATESVNLSGAVEIENSTRGNEKCVVLELE